jgi:hypothetical protein
MVKPRREQLTNTPINANFSEGLVFDEQNAGFGAGHVSAGKGIIWIDNSTSPSRLIFTDENGTDHDITSGGAGIGTLAEVLNAGNTTDGYNIQISNGYAIIGDPGALSMLGDGGNVLINAGTATIGHDGYIQLKLGTSGNSTGIIDFLDGASSFVKYQPNGLTSLYAAPVSPATVIEYSKQIVELRQADQNTDGNIAIFIHGANATSGSAGGAGAVVMAGGKSDGYVSGGDISAFGGSGGSISGSGGQIVFQSGPSITPIGGGQAILLMRGGNEFGAGGGIEMTAGLAGAGSGSAGGSIEIECQNGDGYGSGGGIELVAGGTSTTPAAYGSNIQIFGASATGTVYPEVGIPAGGSIVLEGGSNANGSFGAYASFSGAGNIGGGPIIVTAGNGLNAGGLINITAGSAIGPEVGDIIQEPTGGGINIIAGSVTYVDSRLSAGGTIFIKAGDNASTTNASGGNVEIISGDCLSGASGDIILQSADGYEGSNILIQSGNTTVNGSSITLRTGSSGSVGGSIKLETGNSTSGLNSIELLCGLTTGADGADISISSGNANGNFNGGDIAIVCGNGGTGSSIGNGGNAAIVGGNAVGTDGYGGNITLDAGDGNGIYYGGNIILTPGAGAIPGSIKLQDSLSAIKFETNDTGIGFYATAPIAKPTITGSRGGNVALASLLTELANLGLITDSTSA